MATQHKSAALPLALAYAALIVYASLYPFADWRDQGIAPWSYLAAPWPKYWTGFDFGINVAGYMPLGFLAAIALLRTQPGIGPGACSPTPRRASRSCGVTPRSDR